MAASKTIRSVLAVAALAGCDWFGAEPTNRKILVPDELVKQSDYTPEGQYPRSRYVLRMTDGERDWEVEFPEVASGYEIRIPLKGEPNVLNAKAQGTPLTAADREILADMQRNDPDAAPATPPPAPTTDAMATSGGDTTTAVAPAPGAPAPNADAAKPRAVPTRSYLEGMAEIRELYRTKNYDVALVQLVSLEKQYPNDAKLLSMKGSLYRQLGRRELAREAWEAVLKINPDDLAVRDALDRLDPERGGNR